MGEKRDDGERYKEAIIKIVSKSEDIKWLEAVYSFAKAYPDNRKGAG